jgi:hypothetical protein
MMHRPRSAEHLRADLALNRMLVAARHGDSARARENWEALRTAVMSRPAREVVELEEAMGLGAR